MTRAPELRLHDDEMIVDNFAGGGGASLGIEWALGRSPDVAVNHDPEAIAMHTANHPNTRHLCGDVWDVEPRAITGGRRVGLAWFSPDCKHFSRAKGGKPVEKGIRGLAWVVVRWAKLPKAERPRVIILENVEEFQDWGPLLEDGTPCPLRKGFTFRRWWAQLVAAGYHGEMRELRACDYGAPTSRKRLFIIFRCDGRPVAWPEPTHGPGLEPYRTAAECIDWSLACNSIFERKRPLVEATLRRVGRGVWRYVINSASPFIVPITHHGDDRVYGLDEPMRTITAAKRGEHALVAPALINTRNGEREGQAPRVRDIRDPMPTITALGSQGALVAAFLAKHYGGPAAIHKQPPGLQATLPLGTITAKDHHALVASSLVKLYGTCADGQPIGVPLPTIRAEGTHLAEVRAFLIKYYGTDQDPSLREPLHTVTTKDRFGLVTVAGSQYAIGDIGMRMLVPRELFRGQSFPDSYKIDVGAGGLVFTKEAQVRMVGNSVCPILGKKIVAANFVEQAARVIA